MTNIEQNLTINGNKGDGVFGIRTRDRSMEGEDDWSPQPFVGSFSLQLVLLFSFVEHEESKWEFELMTSQFVDTTIPLSHHCSYKLIYYLDYPIRYCWYRSLFISLLFRSKLLTGTWFKISVTRFGEISPLWQNFRNLWPFIEGQNSIWQHFEHILANYWCCWANVNCCKWTNIEHIIKPSGHTV